MDITRIDTYNDSRFSRAVLHQHGCFLIDEEPYEIEIISSTEAVVRGANREYYSDLIEEFRFYTPHITIFYDCQGKLISKFAPVSLLKVNLDDIQPSQFYVDEDKIDAIRSFIRSPEDIIIQVMRYGDRYISLDGHTRLYYAVMNGWTEVMAAEDATADYIYGFVKDAINRKITTPYDLQLVSHADYQEKWNKFCDEYFNSKEEKT